MKKLCSDFGSLQSICLVSKYGSVPREVRRACVDEFRAAPREARRALAADGNAILARAAASYPRGRLKRKSYCLLEKRLITVKLNTRPAFYAFLKRRTFVLILRIIDF